MLYRTIILIAVISGFSTATEDQCLDLRNIFSYSISSFTSCAIQNARPITMCQQCIVYYLNILESYENMTRVLDNGTACIDNYVDLDRLQIINTLKDSSSSLWNRAKCYECFKIVNGTLTDSLSLKAVQFNEHYTKYHKCVDNRNGVPDNTVCADCLEEYNVLNNYYRSISNENEYIGVCMDIVDRMNATWAHWSSECCKYRRHNEYIFVGSAVLMLVTTILFYVIARYCTEKRMPTILHQHRFAESLAQNN